MMRPAALRLVLPLAAAAVASACGSSGSSYSEAEESPSGTSFTLGSEDTDREAAEFDEGAARADAEQEAADDNYSGPCTFDCSGHDAGFAWAADGHDDGGVSNSRSFDEGQEAYDEAVEERVEAKRQEFEDEGADSEYAE